MAKKLINLRVDETLLARFRELAEHKHTTMTGLLTQCMVAMVEGRITFGANPFPAEATKYERRDPAQR